jgi:hypothetical protein
MRGLIGEIKDSGGKAPDAMGTGDSLLARALSAMAHFNCSSSVGTRGCSVLGSYSPWSRLQARPPVGGALARVPFSFAVSSSSMSSYRACVIALSLASSSSAFVLNAGVNEDCASEPASLLFDPQPWLIVLRKSACPAITSLASRPNVISDPPKRRPEPALSVLIVLRFSAPSRANSLKSRSVGGRPPPSLLPSLMNPSPV